MAKNKAAAALSALGASKGGRARAEKLTPERRRDIAKAAGQARWGKDDNLPRSVTKEEAELKIGNVSFPCAVLSDGTRVVAEMQFMQGMGMYRSGALSTRRQDEESGARVPLYLAFKNLEPYVSRHLDDVHLTPLRYRTKAGNIAHGIRADIIPKICEIWLDARADNVLGERQLKIAAAFEVLLRGLAHVGIIALVDEATGYQDERARDALAKILEEFVTKELRPWVKVFPADFYKEMFRLRGWRYQPLSVARPGVVGTYTTDLVYARLAPGLRQEILRVIPRNEAGKPKARLHQMLTDDVGDPRLREHLAAVIALMKASANWKGFKDLIDRALPRFGNTLPLPMPLESGGVDQGDE